MQPSASSAPTTSPISATTSSASADGAYDSGCASVSVSVSENPMRSCSRFIHGGAHQLASPASFMNAGTSVARISVASISTASASPSPNSLMNDTLELANAMKVTANSAAAAVTMRPV